MQARAVPHTKQPIVVAQVGEGYTAEDHDHLSVDKVGCTCADGVY